MQGLNRWKQRFYYALFDRVELTDAAGNYTGEPRIVYGEPVLAKAHISPDKGTAGVEVFGVYTDYDRVIFWDSGDCPITETSAIILDGEPAYDADGNLLFTHFVKRVSRSFNNTMIAIKHVEPERDDGD